MGAYALKDTNGNIVNRLVRVRNPWGADYFSGPWNDNDSRWTTFYKSQVPYSNANDGYFFMDILDLVNSYYYFTINYHRDAWKTSYYERTSDDGSQRAYTFTLRQSSEVYIGADFYDPRMYASGCRQGQQTKGSYSLYKGSTLIDRYSFADNVGYGWTYYNPLTAGTYTMYFQPTWTPYDVRDYTVSVYAP